MIKDIKIKNYKCFTSESINLKKLNFFAGGNAVGKSSFIQSILLLKKAHENGDKKSVLTTDVFGINLGLPKDLICINSDSNQISISINDEKEKVIFEVDDEITNPFSLKVTSIDTIEENEFMYLNAERVGPRIYSGMSSDRDLNVGYKGEYTNHVIKKADLLQIQVHDIFKIEDINRFSACCEAWLNTIIPGIQIKLDTYETINKSTIKYKNKNISSDYYVPTATGFGITYCLPIIVAGLLLSNSKDSMLVIENPEAHLHPYGQSQLGKFLALLSNCGVQVIVETHSEHIINGARLQLLNERETDLMKVFFFKNDDENIVIEKIDVNKNGELDKWPAGFFDQSKKDLRELLRLRVCK